MCKPEYLIEVEQKVTFSKDTNTKLCRSKQRKNRNAETDRCSLLTTTLALQKRIKTPGKHKMN